MEQEFVETVVGTRPRKPHVLGVPRRLRDINRGVAALEEPPTNEPIEVRARLKLVQRAILSAKEVSVDFTDKTMNDAIETLETTEQSLFGQLEGGLSTPSKKRTSKQAKVRAPKPTNDKEPTKDKSSHGDGTWRWRGKTAEARFTIPGLGRKNIPIAGCTTDAQVEERMQLLREAKDSIVQAADDGANVEVVEQGYEHLLNLARATTSLRLNVTRAAIRRFVQHCAEQERKSTKTIAQLCEMLVQGEIAAQFPSDLSLQVRKRTLQSYRTRIPHVVPVVGHILVSHFTEEDGRRLERQLAKKGLQHNYRRAILCFLNLLLNHAVKMRMIKVNPLPVGFVPALQKNKAKTCIYPNDDQKLLGCVDIPIEYRVFYGLIAREGLRYDEAQRLTWKDIDFENGLIKLDNNKTDDPREWDLRPDTLRALKAWKHLSTGVRRRALQAVQAVRSLPVTKKPVMVPGFAEPIVIAPALVYALKRAGLAQIYRIKGKTQQRWRATGKEDHVVFERFFKIAVLLRKHLQKAGVDRADLFEKNEKRIHMRLHDLRASFVTVALANDRTETWISDRTGHKSHEMIDAYRRRARAVKLIGDWLRMDQIIPEVAEFYRLQAINTDDDGGTEKVAPVESRGVPAEEPVTSQDDGDDDAPVTERVPQPLFETEPEPEPEPAVERRENGQDWGTIGADGFRGRETTLRGREIPGKRLFATVRDTARDLEELGQMGGSDVVQVTEIIQQSSHSSVPTPDRLPQSCPNPSTELGHAAARLFRLLPALVAVGNASAARSVRQVARSLATSTDEPVTALATALAALSQAGVADGVLVLDDALGAVLEVQA